MDKVYIIAAVLGVLLLSVYVTSAQEAGVRTTIDECKFTPTAGKCRKNQRKTVWTYSKRTYKCTKITGCYTYGDRNVFRNKQDCKDTCYR